MKKISINLTDENYKKMEEVIASEEISETEFINNAIENTVIVCLGNRKRLGFGLARLASLYSYGRIDEMKKEVQEICQILNLLMEKIKELNH